MRSAWPRARRLRRRPGFSMVELVVVCGVLVVLALTALPMATYTIRRQKETELRQALREMRNAIDEHKRFADAGLLPIDLGTEGYPSELEVLVEGVEIVGQISKRIRFLRRIPVDPMTGEAEWGMRSFQDEWDADNWGGENVFDVFSLSEGVGLDKIPYLEW